MRNMKLSINQQQWLTAHGKTLPIKCKICSNHVQWMASHKKYGTYCSRTCSTLDSKNVAVENAINNVAKYGVSSYTQTAEFKEKKRNTLMLRYGVDHFSKTDMFKEKYKQTCTVRYGSDNYRKTPDCLNKIKQTCLSKYGVESYKQTAECTSRIKQTCLSKYGVDNYSKTSDSKTKRIQTSLDRYEVSNYNQIHMKHILPLLENKHWLYDQYIMMGKTAQCIAAELGIWDTTVGKYLKQCEIAIRYQVGISYACISWLDSIIKHNNIHIQHALNEGEFNIPGTRYKADGYCAESNTVYEFHGDIYHGNPTKFNPTDRPNPFSELTAAELYQKTIAREQNIKELGYNLIVMWESDWNNINKKVDLP